MYLLVYVYTYIYIYTYIYTCVYIYTHILYISQHHWRLNLYAEHPELRAGGLGRGRGAQATGRRISPSEGFAEFCRVSIDETARSLHP